MFQCVLTVLDGQKQSQSFDFAQDKFIIVQSSVFSVRSPKDSVLQKDNLKKQSQFLGDKLTLSQC